MSAPMHPTVVLDLVALNRSLLGEATPNLNAFAKRSRVRTLRPVVPAVTCVSQACMVSGVEPAKHGIVGNGWYDRELAEVQFWKQSNRLVQAEKVWETAARRDPKFTCAKLFWWYNMYAAVDVSVTPRPIYKADGRKLPDIHTSPGTWRKRLQNRLGRFPLFNFWGPASSIISSRWIADAAKEVWQDLQPTLTLVYLPHLDYGLQKYGPGDPRMQQELEQIDQVVGDLVSFFEDRGVRVLIVNEYGIVPVDDAVPINRRLRQQGWLEVRDEVGHDMIDCGASSAFAVADHQVAHVYVKDPAMVEDVAAYCRSIDGVEQVMAAETLSQAGLDHPRCGDLLLVSELRRWFSYDFWDDDQRAPDYARTVDIHRKPGYDPRELFLDPAMPLVKPRLVSKLLRRKLGFRTLLDVIPLDSSLVRGSHGRIDLDEPSAPVVMSLRGSGEDLAVTDVRDLILDHIFEA